MIRKLHKFVWRGVAWIAGLPGTMLRLAFRAACWLAGRPEVLLMSADDDRLAGEPPERFKQAWLGLAIAGLVWGVVLACVWGAAWKVFGDWGFLIMPATITLALYCLWPFSQAVTALGRQIGGKSAERRTLAVAVLVVVMAMCLMRLSPDWQRKEFPTLAWWIAWLRPEAKLYRVLVLMPAWGAWAMLITVKFCRPGQRTEPQVAALARGCDALAVAGFMAVLLGVSIAYFHHLGLGGQVQVPLATIVAAIASGIGFNRASGGLTRQGLLAANLTTQIVFILAYLAGR